MNIYTIGFTARTARDFFETLQTVEARYLLDIRLHNSSQLAGFAKKGNIEYFTERLTGLTYVEAPLLAPEEEMFKEYRKNKEWPSYEKKYLQLLRDRGAGREIERKFFEEGAVLLCSEPTAEQCHRRLAAEFLSNEWHPGARIIHL